MEWQKLSVAIRRSGIGRARLLGFIDAELVRSVKFDDPGRAGNQTRLVNMGDLNKLLSDMAAGRKPTIPKPTSDGGNI